MLENNALLRSIRNDYTHRGYTADVAESRNVMLYAYLHAQALEAFATRQAEIAALTTPEQIAERQQRMKANFRTALGEFPDRTPLNARVVGVMQSDGYRIERVIYESRPNHHVTANLYLPESKTPVPGVLVPCGHSANGKASEAYQRLAVLLARNGMAALVYDPIGQGERNQILTEDGQAAFKPTFEHNMLGAPSRLVGRCLAHYRIWDGMRSLDYLESRPEIDPARLGCTGNSGGGTLTSFLMSLDDRVAVAAPSCYLTSYERQLITMGLPDDEQSIPAQHVMGLKHADYLILRAPKPTLMLVATQDFFDIDGAWDTYREAKSLFCLLDAGDHLDIFEFNDTHGFSAPRRKAAVRWMRRWLLGDNRLVSATETPVHAEEALWCTPRGQVVRDLQSTTVIDLNSARERELAAERAKFQAACTPDAFREAIRRKIALRMPIPVVHPTRYDTVEAQGHAITELCFETEPGIFVPALLYTPMGTPGPWPLSFYVHGEGNVAAGEAVTELVKKGTRVLAVEPRGIGETHPIGNGYAEHFGRDYNEASLSLNLARPLLGQRVYDLLVVLEYAANDPLTQRDEISVVGIGRTAPLALHAAALDTRIARVTIEHGLHSWASVVHATTHHDQFTNVVPGALELYDLPDLAQLIAPRTLCVRNENDPMGKPVLQPALEP